MSNSAHAREVISIHAPTRGATRHARILIRKMHNFNPRSHKGSDEIGASLDLEITDFNPRSHKGSDFLIL